MSASTKSGNRAAPRWWQGLIVLATVLVVQFLGILGLNFSMPAIGAPIHTYPVWWRALAELLLGLSYLAVLFIALRLHSGNRTRICGERVGWLAFPVVIVLILATAPWSALLKTVLTHTPYTIESNPLSIANAISFVAVVLVAPLGEELFFRGYLLRALSHRSRLLGVVLTAILFSAVHSDFPTNVAHLPFGFAAAAAVVLARSVYPMVVAHAVTNACIFFGFPLMLVQPSIPVLVSSAMAGVLCLVILKRIVDQSGRASFETPASGTGLTVL